MRDIKKGIVYSKALEDAKLVVDGGMEGKAGAGPGYLEGYLAVFGNVDSGGDRFIKGAFAKSIQERVPAGKVPLMLTHFAYGGDVRDVIGSVTEAKEDDFGLWIHAKFSGVDEAQQTRTKIKEGHVKGMSVGYELVRWDNEEDGQGNTIWNLREAKLAEGTVTVRPMNELATIQAAKNLYSELTADGSSLSPEKIETLCSRLEDLLAHFDSKTESNSDVAPRDWDVDIERMRVEVARSKVIVTKLS